MIQQRHKLSLKNLFIVFFFILPLIFYAIPALISWESESVTMYFYNQYEIPFEFFIINLIGYIILGSFLLLALKPTNYILSFYRNSDPLYSLLCITIYFVFLFIPLWYFTTIIYSFFIILIARFRPSKFTFIVLFSIAFIKMILTYDRYPVIFISILYFLPWLSTLSIKKVTLTAFIGIFLLVYVLQPLRAGIIPFTNLYYDSQYIFQHMFPIYIGAFLQYDYNFEISHLISESIPLGKSLLGTSTSIDIIARENLPSWIYQEGTRLGSNSSMYFRNASGIIILSILITALSVIIKKINKNIVHNSILLFFLFEGVYFIRRSIGTVFIQFTIFIIFLLIYHTIGDTRKKNMSNAN